MMKAKHVVELLKETKKRIRENGKNLLLESDVTLLLDAHMDTIQQFEPELEIELPEVLKQMIIEVYIRARR